MLKRILLSGVALTFCAGMAVAQTAAPDQSTSPTAQNSPAGSMGGPSAGAGSGMSENQADASLFSNIKGADVVGSDNKEVGRLADILLDDQGNIQQIVIGSGGIAGVGETLHAYDQASLPTLNGDGKIQLGLTTASLDSLPEYTYPEKVETGRATTGDAGGAMSSSSGSAGSGAMAPNPSAPSSGAASSGAASGGSAAGGSQPSADASSGASSGAASGSSSGNMLSSENAGSQMGAAGGSSAPQSGAASGGADQSASADAGKDAGSSAGGASDQSTAANIGGAAGSSAPSASGSSSAPDQTAANDTGAAASGGKAWPASYLVGANIANAPDGAEIGDLHFAGSKVDKVVINHGGTLGVGEKQMEVAFNDLQISGDATDPKVELQGDPLQQLNQAAEEEKAKKDTSPAK